MAPWVVPAIVGGLSFFGSRSKRKEQERQTKAANDAARRDYEYRMKVRERNWYQTLSIWGAKRTQFDLDIDENNLALARGFEQAQQGLNNAWSKAAQSNEKALIQFFREHGQHAAKGRTGRSHDRIDTLNIGQLERYFSQQSFALTRSKESYLDNVRNMNRQATSRKNKLFANVALAPTMDATPPPPVMQPMPQNNLFGDLLNAGVAGYSAYQQFSGGNNWQNNNINSNPFPYTPTPDQPQQYLLN